MVQSLAEQLLARVMFYLEESGAVLDRASNMKALRLVEAALKDETADPERIVMGLLPQYFDLPELPVPPAFPPLTRGSIGYDVTHE